MAEKTKCRSCDNGAIGYPGFGCCSEYVGPRPAGYGIPAHLPEGNQVSG